MKLKNFAYAALVAAAAVAFVLGSATTGEAKHKKKAAAPPPQPQICIMEYAPVCGSLKGHKFTYANACSAYKDGASVVSRGACHAKKAHAKKRKHKKAKKAMKKPSKKAAKKKM